MTRRAFDPISDYAIVWSDEIVGEATSWGTLDVERTKALADAQYRTQERDASDQLVRDLRKSLADLTEEKDQAVRDCQGAQANYAQLKQDRSEALAEQTRVRNENAVLRNDKARLTDQIHLLSEQVSALEPKVAQVVEELAEARSQRSDLFEEGIRLKKESHALKDEIDDLHEINAQLNRQVADKAPETTTTNAAYLNGYNAGLRQAEKDELIRRLRAIMEEQSDDGASVFEYVLAANPDLRQQFIDWLNTPKPVNDQNEG